MTSPSGPPRRVLLSAAALPPHTTIFKFKPRRAQYSRFDDHPNHQDSNRPPPSFSAFQRRDVIIYSLGVGSVVYYLLHLEQVPETGRWRFMDVSPKFEAALWEASYERTLPAVPTFIASSREYLRQTISARFAAIGVYPLPRAACYSQVFGAGDGESEEAVPDLWDPDSTGHGAAQGSGKEWNLTGGTVVVFTGILPVAKDEQGLAAILGHEIGHVERYSYSKIFIAMAWLADIIGLPSGVGGLATTLLMDLPHSRKQEYEAPEMFKRLGALEKSDGGMNVSFLNTHPASDERVRYKHRHCGGVSDYMGAFGEAIGLERRARAPWE
ncbi:hypothetical protein EDB89DRAFT_1908314 [Lactarius sanguifluus]|nr:hypothetical protein EDB89DRAFT_1908314 [Lactarius sanguifluus]